MKVALAAKRRAALGKNGDRKLEQNPVRANSQIQKRLKLSKILHSFFNFHS